MQCSHFLYKKMLIQSFIWYTQLTMTQYVWTDHQVRITFRRMVTPKSFIFNSKEEDGAGDPTVSTKLSKIVLVGPKLIKGAPNYTLQLFNKTMGFCPLMNRITLKTGQESFLSIAMDLDIKEQGRIQFLTKARIFISEDIT